MKNILFIHDSMKGGGAERVLVSILNNLSPDDYKITLLLLYGEGDFMKSIPPTVETITLFHSYNNKITRLLTHFKLIRNFTRRILALKKLSARKFDAIISFMEGAPLRLHYDLRHLAPLNCSWIHCNIKTHHWYKFWLTRQEEERIYRQMDRIAFVSAGAKDAFSELFPDTAQKLIIRNPLDSKNIIRQSKEGIGRPTESKSFRIVTAGRLIPVKRHEILLEAVSILSGKGYDISLDILGSGPRETELKQLAREYGIDDIVTFHNFVSNPYPYIRLADLFCLTSESEGFSMVVAEALILNTPVISTPVNGVTEMLSVGGGIILEGNAEEFASEIESLIVDREKLNSLKESAKLAAKQFDISEIMSQIEAFIQ